jgi:hypothetical protein
LSSYYDDAAMTHFSEPADYRDIHERIITSVAWRVPLIELRNERWLVEAGKTAVRRAGVPRGGLLRAFCRLQDAKPSRIAAFAQKYGLLYLCLDHHLPQWHSGYDCRARVLDTTRYERCDDLEDWRAWARRFLSLIELTRSILNKRPPLTEDVEAVFSGFGSRGDDIADQLRRPKWADIARHEILNDGTLRQLDPLKWEPQDYDVQLDYVVEWLNSLLAASNVRRGIVQPASRHALAMVDGLSATAPLFGALVNELGAACANLRTVARCHHCGRGFTPTRVSAAYCSKCRDPRVRWKRAQQRQRELKRARGLSSRGRPLARSPNRRDT